MLEKGSVTRGIMNRSQTHPLEKVLESRIAILDGAMGTTIRTYGATEADVRGQRFREAKKDLLNNGDLFTLTRPEMIGDITAVSWRPGPTSSRRIPSGRRRSRRVSFSWRTRESAEGERFGVLPEGD